ncbi:MAG: hypothetical protein PHP79_05005 [Clostridia bacterium]|nr:hypothetical protein [Clostridia bacterium]
MSSAWLETSYFYKNTSCVCFNEQSPMMRKVLNNLTNYVIRAPISQERMIYIAAFETPGGIAKVIYTGKSKARTIYMDTGNFYESHNS